MPVIDVRFKLEKETKGALRYQRSMRKTKSSNKPGPRSAHSTSAKVHSSVALHSRRSCELPSNRWPMIMGRSRRAPARCSVKDYCRRSDTDPVLPLSDECPLQAEMRMRTPLEVPTTLQVVIPAPRRWRELGHDLQGATGP
jgi:hypothetical protein